ncbi:hypothetical protein BpHYR1_007959 [Brachionus plicatilis]|uniref:Uncharacterized protein n=1 Tax=Brachionus plicatilis TaxID=10195 RepID=A0A3M7QAS2_BRAPC|nr:hypothetical protein BpHYR1_007959 [Brachionus plicatilis]
MIKKNKVSIDVGHSNLLINRLVVEEFFIIIFFMIHKITIVKKILFKYSSYPIFRFMSFRNSICSDLVYQCLTFFFLNR